MRLTVKAKLAGAFGVVIVLSMVAGGVAYLKLTEMVATAESLVSRSDRMEKATELECSICENVFERGDIAMCPAYSGPICSLCCTLETSCGQACQTSGPVLVQLRPPV